MAKLSPRDFKSVQTGLIMKGAVSESRMPLDAVLEVTNMHFDKIGSATVRPGLTQVGDDKTGDVLGLYNFRDSGAGTNNRMIMVNGTVAYYLSGSTWTSKRTGLTASSKAEFTTFLDFTFMVNGTEATAIWSGATGDSFITTGNAANAPIGKYIENFRSRVWITGNSTYPDRVYFSSLPSSVTTPVIEWDTDVNTGQWIDVSPSDGENNTAIIRDINSLLVFKNNHIYRIYTVNDSEPDPKFNVGTYSNRSVVKSKAGIFFHHPTGFYQYANGSIQEISRPIIDVIENITLANYTKIAGWEDGDHVYWAVGDVTIDGVTIDNATARYTISTQTWTVYSYPTQFIAVSPYNDGTTLFQLVGDDAGEVYKVNVGDDDDGTPIQYSLVHRWVTLDGLLSTEKMLGQVLFSHANGAGTKVQYQEPTQDEIDWTNNIGQLEQFDTLLKDMLFKGRKIRFRISGESAGTPFSYNGFEIPDGDANFLGV